MARETAFHPVTSRTAAGFGDEAGWLWVTNFGDVDAEWLERLITLVDGAVVNALIEVNPDPRAVAARVLREALLEAGPSDSAVSGPERG